MLKNTNHKQLRYFSKEVLFLIFYALMRNHLFEYIGFENWSNLLFLGDLFCLLFVLVYSHSFINPRSSGYPALIFYGLCITFMVSLFLWPSKINDSLRTFLPIFGISIYFYLKRANVSAKEAEFSLIIMAILYLICWIIAIYSLPDYVFGQNREIENYESIDIRGFFRFWIPDRTHYPFLIFYFMGGFLMSHKNKYLLGIIIVMVVIVLHVGRQSIFWSFALVMLFYLSVNRKHLLLISIICILTYLGLSYLIENIDILDKMISITSDQMSDAKSNVRYGAFYYYIFDYPHNILSIIFGNGEPVYGSTLWAIFQKAASNGWHLQDIGYLGTYCNYGIWMVIILMLMLVRIISIRVEDKYQYLKFYIYYEYCCHLLGHSLTTDIYYVIIAYYILELSSSRIKKQLCHGFTNCVHFN